MGNGAFEKKYTTRRTFFRFTLHIGKKSVHSVWVPTLVPIRVSVGTLFPDDLFERPLKDDQHAKTNLFYQPADALSE